MQENQVVDLIREALWTGFLVAGPILITVLIVGVMVGIFQAATSINESTITFLPKVIAAALVILFIGSWQLNVLVDFTRRIFERIPGTVN
jgi:flagellar biosynthesis protein FliQ